MISNSKLTEAFLALFMSSVLPWQSVTAADLVLPDSPIFVGSQDISPLVMLVMGRDHTLYYEAYNDATDLDGDGNLDTYFKPDITYYGYFDSAKCYDYASNMFEPTGVTKTGQCKSEGGSGRWSGNLLNYLTTSRIDALRKVLYGGSRKDNKVSSDGVILERAFIPQDAHTWGKTWDASILGLSIDDYTPLSPTTNSKRNIYFFANTSLGNNQPPLLRVLRTNADASPPLYIWNWVSKERPVAGDSMDNYSGSIASQRTDYTVRVRVCKTGLLEENCQLYGSNYAPVGLLQKYGEGENPKMEFGLITGSYKKNLSGGVLRARIGKMQTEINSSTGEFKSRPTNVSIIYDTLEKLRVSGFDFSSYSYNSNCGWISNGPISDGQCSSWGNPIGEMLYESLRYFSGAKSPTSTYTVDGTDELSLKEDAWDDPFAAAQGRPYCAKPVNLVISDVGVSYDSDQLPGSEFQKTGSSYSFKSLNVANETAFISQHEGLDGGKYFIGEVKGSYLDETGAPTAKLISNLSKIRGLSPMEPTKGGSYYSAGIAYYGLKTDLNSREGEQKAKTVVVAMASALPNINIRVGSSVVTLVPFAKTVSGSTLDSNKDQFRPTNSIVDFYVEKITPTEGKFRINYEDVEQGADHDMDMIVSYEYKVIGNKLHLTLESEYAYGGEDQHAGYVISGTTNDGLYLDVEDKKDGGGGQRRYHLDTVGEEDSPYPNNIRSNTSLPFNTRNAAMPLKRTRIFEVSANSKAAEFLPSPLWFAAKWGGFADSNNNQIPDSGEWDSMTKGTPDNYFLVTNANNLEKQLEAALSFVDESARSGTNASFSSAQLSEGALYFSANFEAMKWSGKLEAYPYSDGVVSSVAKWSTDTTLRSSMHASRTVYTMDEDGHSRVFTAPSSLLGSSDGLSQAQIETLSASMPNGASASDSDKLAYVTALVNYLRGDETYTKGKLVPGTSMYFRERATVLGDIVNSTPTYGVSAGDKQPFVIFGANDGMVHVLNAETGAEIFAYIPSPVFSRLADLSLTSYNAHHQFFVDGPVKIAQVMDGKTRRTIAVGGLGLGGQGLWALDLTNLSSGGGARVLWEFTDRQSPYIGFVTHAPAMMRADIDSHRSRWVAIVGNGYNSSRSSAGDQYHDANGYSALLVVDVLNGSLHKTLVTQQGKNEDPLGQARPNAMTAPVIADIDMNDTADALYSGDLFGNLWKVQIEGKTVANWAFELDAKGKPLPMFKAITADKVAQPITHRPSVARHPQGGALVLFGTGKYLELADTSTNNQPTQSVYALWDWPGRSVSIESDRSASQFKLLQQSILQETGTPRTRITSQNLIDWTSAQPHRGWYLDLTVNGHNQGERIHSEIVVRNSVAAFTTIIPNDDICAGGGKSWYMEVGVYTGSNSFSDLYLVDSSIELSGIAGTPTAVIKTDADGNKVLVNVTDVDKQQGSHFSPGQLQKTGTLSWQRLF